MQPDDFICRRGAQCKENLCTLAQGCTGLATVCPGKPTAASSHGLAGQRTPQPCSGLPTHLHSCHSARGTASPAQHNGTQRASVRGSRHRWQQPPGRSQHLMPAHSMTQTEPMLPAVLRAAAARSRLCCSSRLRQIDCGRATHQQSNKV